VPAEKSSGSSWEEAMRGLTALASRNVSVGREKKQTKELTPALKLGPQNNAKLQSN